MTPRPWRVRLGVCRNDHPDTSADVQGAHGEFVADCGCHELANANAEFIVRACNSHADLLAALKGAVETIETWHSIHDANDDAWDIYRKHAPEMKLIMAAIEKAESRTR